MLFISISFFAVRCNLLVQPTANPGTTQALPTNLMLGKEYIIRVMDNVLSLMVPD